MLPQGSIEAMPFCHWHDICYIVPIGPVSGSRYMALLRTTGAYWGLSETNWGLDTRIVL